MAYHRILIVVPCATQEDLVVYFTYKSLHLVIPDSQSVPSTTPALLSTSLDSISMLIYDTCFLLTDFTLYDSL